MKSLFTLALALIMSPLALGEDSSTLREQVTPSVTGERRIEDNSFLIEEAYNQEARVIQHIQNFSYYKDKTWLYQFTQEWPIAGRAHQLSFGIPFARALPDMTGGIGDIIVNYRYQLVDERPVAVSPRFSLVTPTGDYRKGLGTGGWGYETNLPMSVSLGRAFVTHWNLGARFTTGAKAANGRTDNLVNVNYGTSFVWLTTQNLNFLVELAGGWDESLSDEAAVERKHKLFINPGVRGAVNLGDLQVVPGISAPIGVGPSNGTYGVLAYLSFEHPY